MVPPGTFAAWAWAMALLLPMLQASGVPPIYNDFSDFGPTIEVADSWAYNGTLQDGLERRADKPSLRVLPLGASIVWGQGSSHGNGFRQYLRDQLRFEGFEVNMVGNRQGGNMKDNDNQATPGIVIDQAYEASKSTYKFFPNVVVINCGTNDVNGNVDIPNAGTRMRRLITEYLAQPGMDKTVIVLSTLIPSGKSEFENRRHDVNRQYRDLVKSLRGEGKNVILADMDPVDHAGNGWIDLRVDMTDDIHPNDDGFKKMAYIFFRAIMKAHDDKWIQEPKDAPALGSGSQVDNKCSKVAGNGVYSGGLTQKGSGQDDGIYYHDSVYAGVVLTYDSDYDRNQFRFGRLFSRQLDDLAIWYDKRQYAVFRNTGNSAERFVKIADMNVGIDCGINGTYFRDVNADGLDDFVCIGPDGDMYVSLNQGDGTASKPPSFKPLGNIMGAKLDYPREKVLLADIDGDGRCDYCVMLGNGDIRCWRNGGFTDNPDNWYWQALNTVFTAKGMGDGRGVRFYDLNGDGRDDWLWVSDSGQTTTWTNSRSCAKGWLATWRQGFAKGASSGPTHAGVGGTDKRYRIHFARIHNNPQDFGLLGRADYVYIEHSMNGNKHRFKFVVYKNQGSGSTKLKADGNKYCNMMGGRNGREDYVWVHSKGAMTLYPNLGKLSVSDGSSFWGPSVANIFDPNREAGKSLDRRDLHLVDWDNDGACDVVWVDPENDNRVTVWLNQYPRTKTWTWQAIGNPAPQLSCSQRRGVGIFDLPVRFADISGTGRADYLCIEKDGRTSGWERSADGSWSAVAQFKKAEGADRANLRWADVDGDGRDDMLWIDKFTGHVRVWLNVQREQVSGSAFRWQDAGRLYDGNQAGPCEYFPDFTGNGRADIHYIKGSWTNEAETYFNLCRGDNTGDDGSTGQDPKLPVQPGSGGGGNGDKDADYKPPKEYDDQINVCTAEYSSLDAVLKDIEKLSGICGAQYIIQQIHTSLDDGLKRYGEIIKDGYDGYFGTYANYLVDNQHETAANFLKTKGDDYFRCNVTEQRTCCRVCKSLPSYDCTDCIEDKDCPAAESPWDDYKFWYWSWKTCPPKFDSWTGFGDNWKKTLHWELKDGKRNDFIGNFSTDIGCPADKVKFKDYVRIPNHNFDQGCARESAVKPVDKMSESCYREGFWFGAAMVEDFKTDDVLNPKVAVENSLGKLKQFKADMAVALWHIKLGVYEPSLFDAIDTALLPVMMLEQSVEHMEEVVKLGKEIREADKKFLIVNILSSVLFLIPVAGSALGSIGLAGFGRFLVWFGELGNVGLSIYGLTEDPQGVNFFLFFFELALVPGSLRSAQMTKRAADARRNIPEQDISGFSAGIAQKLARAGKLSKSAGKRPVCLG